MIPKRHFLYAIMHFYFRRQASFKSISMQVKWLQQLHNFQKSDIITCKYFKKKMARMIYKNHYFKVFLAHCLLWDA